MLVKLMSQEINLATESDVNLASVVRLINTGSNTQLVSLKKDGEIVASLTLSVGETVHLQKEPTQTIVASNSVKAVKIAYSN